MSSAVAPSVSEALPRKTAASSAAGGKEAAAAAQKPVKYSHRQAKSYKKDELKPFTVPDLTVKDLLSAIPKHCFERSAFKSSLYVLQDAILISALGYAASYIDPTVRAFDFSTTPLAPYLAASTQATVARWSAWFLYTLLQGWVMTGVWIIAHECGHGAYSTSKTINNAVGWVLHSALLVPYYSWKISHARHHAATGHLTRDEVFVPRTRAQKGLLPLRPAQSDSDFEDEQTIEESLQGNKEAAAAAKDTAAPAAAEEEETWGEWFHELLEDAPAYNLVNILIQQLFGWPAYLISNASGQLHFPKGTNHFDPDSFIFEKRHRMQIIISDLGLALAFAAIGTAIHLTSFATVARYYLIPYLWVNHWLVMITYLQHTDPLLPHYTADAWTFPRGALCTIDRKWLGPVGPYLLHGIAETHVAHHISSKIPHYHAWEATDALKERLGEHYHCTDENVFVSLWKTMRNCKWVEEGDKVAFYRNAHGVPACAVKDHEGESDSGLALSE